MVKIPPFHDDVLRDLAALNPDPMLWSPKAHHLFVNCICFGLVADEHHDALVAEFQNYQLSPDDELPLYSADSRVDTFWEEMTKKKKTFAGGIRFQHLAHLMTTLSVIAHSNSDSECVISMCRKIDTNVLLQLSNDTAHYSFMQNQHRSGTIHFSYTDNDLRKSTKSATWNYMYMKDHQ